jgi:hypothetical protein
MKKIIISLFIFSVLISPAVSLAQTSWGGLIPCDNTPTIKSGVGNATTVVYEGNHKPCDFKAFLNLINNVISFIFVYMAVPISALMFAFAGFEMVTSGGSEEKRGMGKKVFSGAVFGLVVSAAAWLIIRTLLMILGYDGAWIFDGAWIGF